MKTSFLKIDAVDWLLVRHMTFEGHRHSMERLQMARECCVLASRLIDGADYDIGSETGPAYVFVTIQGWDIATRMPVMRDYPHYGLVELYALLRQKCADEDMDTAVSLSEYDGLAQLVCVRDNL